MNDATFQRLIAQLGSLPPNKRRLLELRLRKLQQQHEELADIILPFGRERPLPLAFAQRRIWLQQSLEPLNPFYNLPSAVSLAGVLDLGALNATLQQLVKRHEPLRTSFEEIDGEPHQRVHAQMRVAIPLVDLRGLQSAHRQEIQQNLLNREALTALDLGRAPLIRVLLLCLEPELHVLAINQHHIVSDGWSLGLLVQELIALYRSQVRGLPSPLPPLTVQYADFAAWQQGRMSPEVVQAEIEHWRQRLAGIEPSQLPTDLPRPRQVSYRGRRVAGKIRPALTSALRKLARSERASLFMALLAVYSAQLARLSGHRDLGIGTPVAGRRLPVLEALMGMFVNTLVLRVPVDLKGSFRQLLAAVRGVSLEAFSHQELPFEQLVEELVDERDPSRNPLFQIFFSHHAQPPEAPSESLEGLSFEPAEQKTETTLVDLTLESFEAGEGIQLVLGFSTDLFYDSTALRWLNRLEGLVAATVEHPDRPLQDLLGLPPVERQQVLVEWNDSPTRSLAASGVQAPKEALFGDDGPATVQGRVMAVCARRPDAVAVVEGALHLSYLELERRSRGLALGLASRGVTSQGTVGVGLERGVELVVTLLGILRLGAAYVPLDPLSPSSRLQEIASDADLSLIVATASSLPGIPEITRCEASSLLSSAASNQSSLDESSELGLGSPPEGRVYVIYTSGSTGKPKGVQVGHAGVLRLADEGSYLDLGSQDRVALASNPAFDALTFELWCTLFAGGTAVVLPQDAVLSPRNLAQSSAQERIGVLFLTTALFNEVVRRVPRAFARMRAVLFGGEASDPLVAAQLQTQGPPQRLLHMYGPTETTTFATWQRLHQVRPGQRSLSIGRSVAQSSTYVLDRELQPVAMGAAGELSLGGSGLAWGYLARPARTALSFVPDPWSKSPGARLYRTGDLVRWEARGGLEFLGRIDHQVKIRGLRIELGEIESALSASPLIAEASVQALAAPGGQQLVAFVVLQDQPAEEPQGAGGSLHKEEEAQLRNHLAQLLPDYMEPAVFVCLPSLPLNANGKVDRKALPEPSWGDLQVDYIAPVGPYQELVASTFAELLSRDRVGATDDFFAMGGHSLMAARVISRLEAASGLSLSLQDLFQGSTVAALAGRLQELDEGESTDRSPRLQSLPAVQRGPLSFAQERLWFLHLLEPYSSAYNVPASVALEGDLEPSLLAAALSGVQRRHEALRTVFRRAEGAAKQQVLEPGLASLPLVDLSGLPAEDGRRQSRRWVGRESSRPFDLQRGPVMRALLFQRGARDHGLLLNVHHIVSDGWSTGVLIREVGELYQAAVAGRNARLPALPVQYGDFAVWQRELLSGSRLQSQVDFWKKALAEAPLVIDLPLDRPRPALASPRGGQVPLRLDSDSVGLLKELAREQGGTLFMACLAAFASVLGRWSGQGDLLVGSPVAGRNRPEIEDLIGFFVNTLVFRVQVAGAASFRELLPRVVAHAQGALSHQELPFERLVEELAPERDTARTPLFQIMLALQNAPVGTVELSDLRLLPEGGAEPAAKFELTLNLEENSQGGLDGFLEYRPDLFDHSTVRRLADAFCRWSASAARLPERRVEQHPWLSAAQRHACTVEWARGLPGTAMAETQRLESLFRGQVRRSPEAVAIEAGQEQLSWGELGRRVRGLAAELRRRGVGAETRVAVVQERSPWWVISMLAVLESGGAYVPLDPASPPSRLRGLLQRSRAALVLARAGKDLPLEQGLHYLDPEQALPLDEAASTVSFDGGLQDLAYVIYTSGSTGQPKGVGVTHRSALRHMLWMSRELSLGDGDRLLQRTAPTFDASVWELWMPLVCGARLVLPLGGEERDPKQLGILLRRRRITHLQGVPSLLRWLHSAGSLQDLPLRQLASGGEVLDLSLRDELLSSVPGARLVNLYGPTETTIQTLSQTWMSHAGSRHGVHSATVGQPIHGTRAVVVDEQLRPVPLGAPGELLLGGECAARGYLDEPALTAASFVPDPWAQRPGDRAYRSGDRVRWLADGKLEVLGRLDHQVKIRGFRVEPGEVAALLRQQDAVHEAVVVPRQVPGTDGAHRARDLHLVAYVVPGPQGVDGAELRRRLSSELPEHMVPAAIVELEELPLTRHGKLDRAALPDAQVDLTTSRPPRGPVEELVAATFAQVLGIACPDAERSFFELGGHSLLAAQVCMRLERALDQEVPLALLFAAPSVADLAAALQRNEGAGSLPSWSSLPAIESGAESGAELVEAPLSFSQERLWFIDRLEPGLATYNVPMPLALVGALDSRALELALGDVVRRHAVLRTVYGQAGGANKAEAIQRIGPPRPFHLPRVDLRALSLQGCRREARRLATEEVARPFDLEQGPVLRVLLLHLAPAEGETSPDSARHELLATVHHIASDAWSMGILSRELGAAYAARLAGQLPQLPALAVQYADFARWQRQHLGEEALASELAWWQQQLSGLPPVLELPTDRPRPAVASYRGAMVQSAVGAELGQLRQLALGEGATIYMALLALFQALLARLSGSHDIAVGSPVAGRLRPELENLIGFFTNTLVLRGDLRGQPSLRELLRRTRGVTLEAYARQSLPFEQLVEALAPQRSLSHSPLFQVLLSLDNASSRPGTGLQLEGLRLGSSEGGEWSTSKFDLSLFTWERQGNSPTDAGLDLSLEYARDLYDRSTAQRVLTRFCRLLASAVAEPERPLESLSWLSPAEQHQTTVEMAEGPGASQGPALGLCARLARTLERQPEGVAVSGAGVHLSYAELHRRAELVARRLQARGVGPDRVVGVWAQRRVETAIAVLAVLRSGAAYLPLDPSYPSERLAFMVEDAGVEYLLHGEGSDEAARDLPSVAHRWSVEELCREEVSAPGSQSEPWRDDPEALAYVIYTSGSTGQPKGVGMGRGAMAQLLDWQARDLRGPLASRTLQFAALSFDVSFQELATTWAYGGTLVLVDEATRRDGRALLAHLVQERVERLFLPFVALEHLAETSLAQGQRVGQQPTLALRELITAGEQLRLSWNLRRWLKDLGAVDLHNHYGPSETHVVSAWSLPRSGWAGDLPPIGRPIDGTRLEVLDASGRPQGLGVPGELLIGGRSVGRGYLGRPALTAASFVPDPAALGYPHSGQRRYRSGDLVRWLASGDLEFLGRIDQQVKVRGFRVEPGEIEAVLDQHPSVSAVAVTVREDAPGGRALVAYVVPTEGAEVSTSTLRGAVSEQLPPHMVPGFWVVLESLPLTPSGKVDRRSLPALQGQAEEVEPPRGPMEELVAGVYAEVLATQESLTVGRQDDFFSLGGHSLKATQVVSRLEQITGVELSLRTLFQQPTVAGLAAWLEDAGRTEIGSRPPLVATVAHDAAGGAEPVPLSYAQERLWFLDRLQPGSPAYHLPNGVLLEGDLDFGALERAIGAVVQRHGALRSRFLEVDGEPRQQVMPMRFWVLPRVDLSKLESIQQQQEAARWTAANHLLPFDLEQGQLLRTCLVHLGTEDGAGSSARHLLLINMHHIVSDGWSMGVFVGEVVSSYRALAAREVPDLPTLPLQYVDFAQWQRQMLEAGEAERQLAYWREELEGAPTALDLATDRPRPPVQSVRGNSLPLQLGTELSSDLQQLARQEGATLFMVLMAGYAALLARESRQRDVLIGTPIANRNRQEIEGLVGFFVNTLVLRARLGECPSLRQLVAQMRERTLDAYAHQDLPFERLVEGLGLERDLSRPPLFQALLVLQNTPQASAEPSGLQVQSLGGETQTTKFELTLGLEEGPQGLVGGAEYASDLFDSTTVRRLLARFRALLRAAVSEPDSALEDLDLLARAQRHQLLLEWQGQTTSGDASLVPALVDEWARLQPEQLALRSEQGSQSYGELQADSARVAQSLVDRGATAESVVAVELERSPQLVAVLWGVLRAGAAYLPIDPSLPAERKRGMVEDAGALCWVRAGEPAAESPIAQLRPEDLLEDHGADSEAWQDVEIQAQQLAYVIYTSGSTGRPKGVAVSHGALANLVAWHRRAFALEPGQRSTQLAGLGFDASVWEIWPALASGGTLVLAPDEVRLSPSRLPKWLAEEQIDRSFVPTPLLEAALGQNWPEPRPQLLLTGGDRLRTLPTADFEPAVANCYGPTENAVVATWGSVPRHGAGPGTSGALAGDGAASLLPSIGRAVDGCRVGVVDQHLRATALGVPGELVIGGHSLARGYLGQPASSAAAFVPDGLWGEPGARLYRSGDLVRTLADGRLDFLGRVDQQVKVRGFRIELGEIEQVLASHSGLQQAAVLLDGQGDKARLVAYVVADQQSNASAATLEGAELRSWLGQQLPEYMLPAAFVSLEQLPLTPNGKVDRRNLPAPPSLVTSSDELATESQEPRDELEQQLQELWQEVLEVEAVGLHQSFFDLGGHSLLLAKCQTLLKERLGREVPMVDLFRLPTVADLAEHLRGAPAPKRREVQLKERQQRDGAIAIVGLAGRFPGASSVEKFWQNLRNGKETVRFFSPEELREAGVDETTLSSPGFVPAASLLDDPEHFDARLFAISPKEARLLDPQQRLFLECAWTAMEDASCDPAQAPGPVGVYAGIGTSQYWLSVVSNPELAQGLDPLQLTLGNEKDFFATRVAYKLNLKGPSLDVQTACSTSLVATHLACQALQAGDCDLALAGGVSLSGYGPGGYSYQPGGVVSPDGHTRSFDSQAQGTVSGSGVGIVVLKRLEDALRDGDSIRAVIRGTAINNDGSDKVGFTAPSVAGQAEAIARAQAVAGVSPEQISYVEAHGSATPLGDPIEVAALNEVFAGHEGEVLLGAVKSNVGHLDAAAGVTGLIKTVLSLQHRQIPPTLHFEQLNPEIQPGPFRVVSELTEWQGPEDSEEPLRAGVSAFGLGGTNAHVVVEEAPHVETRTDEVSADATRGGGGRQAQLLLLSGASSSAVQQLGHELAEHLEQDADLELADLAHSLRVGRRRLAQRRAVVVGSRDEAVNTLLDVEQSGWLQRNEERQERTVAFLLPGVGDHYAQMGRDLYEQEATFRGVVDRAHQQLQQEQGLDLLGALYTERAQAAEAGDSLPGMDLRKLLGRSASSEAEDEANPLDSTELAQPAVFVLEMALAALWREWGVEPKALIGYSLGEYSAACLAGVFSFEQGLRLVAERARLIQSLPAGGMLAVPVASADLREEQGLADLFEIHPELAVATHNGPQVTVLSGPLIALAAVEARLQEQGQVFQRLSTGHAFHSPMMQPIAADFRAVLEGVDLQPPRIPYLSNVTGTWVQAEQVCNPEHWVQHLCGTVRFAEGLETLLSDSAQVLVEVGPGQALSTAARQHPSRQHEQVVLASLRDGRQEVSDHRFLLTSVGRLWLSGVELDWQGFVRHEQRRRQPLPTYPFERQRFWAQSEQAQRGPGAPAGQLPVTQRSWVDPNDPETWLSTPVWQAEQLPRSAENGTQPGPDGQERWLVVASPEDDAARALLDSLQEAGLRLGHDLLQISPLAEAETSAGSRTQNLNERRAGWAILDGARAEGWSELWRPAEIEANDASEGAAPHAASAGAATSLHLVCFERSLRASTPDSVGSSQALLALGKALAQRAEDSQVKCRVSLVSRDSWSVAGAAASDPTGALCLGAALVLPREVPNLDVRVVDLPASHAAASTARLARELMRPSPQPLVALRGGLRWTPQLQPIEVGEGQPPSSGLRQEGLYVILGGLGRMGRALAESLLQGAAARVVLLGRTPLPSGLEREQYLRSVGPEDPTAVRLRRLQELESIVSQGGGGEIHLGVADVTKGTKLAASLSAIESQFGPVDGVFHLAGEFGGQLVSDQSHRELSTILGPKVEGARHLVSWLRRRREQSPDSVVPLVVFSSSLLGTAGAATQLGLSSASAYLDALAPSLEAEGLARAVTLDWDAWSLGNMEPGGNTQSGIDERHGGSLVLHAVESGLARVLISSQDVASLAQRRLADRDQGQETARQRHQRPELPTPYREPKAGREQQLANIWSQLLGLDRVGAEDNFLELGGDSLLGLQVLARIREEFGVELTVQDLFTAPTVALLAARIDLGEGSGEPEDDSGLEALFASIDQMSVDDARHELAKRTHQEE